MNQIPRIPPSVARKLRHYGYLYVNPLDDSIFYVGKGVGNRALAHLSASARKAISKAIREIRATGARRRGSRSWPTGFRTPRSHTGSNQRPSISWDSTVWRTPSRRASAAWRWAIDGVVRKVYRISEWLEAGSTFNTRLDGHGNEDPGRWEFVGTIADQRTRGRYVNRYVGHLFTQGAQNPISYVNID